jgi:hypothetical protein
VTAAGPADRRTLCPSARNASGASLIGAVDAAGRVVFLGAPRILDPAESSWLDSQGGEAAFRFAGACLTAGCPRWHGSCEVGAVVAAAVAEAGTATTRLPACGIRARCRWWHDQGPAACAGCAYVVTDQPRRLPLTPSAQFAMDTRPKHATAKMGARRRDSGADPVRSA